MNHENEPENQENEKIYNYISVIFENNKVPFSAPPDIAKEFYRFARRYTYKTDKILKAGQVLKINSFSGVCRVMVINPGLLAEEINYDKDKIKELEVI